MNASDKSLAPLTRDALQIWKAGVDAVDSSRLVSQQISAWRSGLLVAGHPWCAQPDSRICVVGAGKAGAGMAAGLERVLGTKWRSRTSGWVNVPEDCVGPLGRIHLHGARPAGLNEPTDAGVAGTREILKRVRSLRPQDLCIVLISGGGSALLPAPVSGISLNDKLQVTRLLMRSGATIEELNCVRRALSEVKGGGLLRACRAGMVVSLIISDVIGDPLETIASGPTVPILPDPAKALEILQQYVQRSGVDCPKSVLQFLATEGGAPELGFAESPPVFNEVIGNNRTAVEVAAREAKRLGFQVIDKQWDQPGVAADAGRKFAERLREISCPGKGCLISGGETTVELAQTSEPQKGGRNQEFALAALEVLQHSAPESFAVVSGGTDGEDGPTDAAGAFIDTQLLSRFLASGLDLQRFLRVNNSYPFFEELGGLLKTGPTHTNVMDLRVGVVDHQ